ncbi:hypothetical protein JHN63_31410 [Streptomyces sp. MBT65]|uniref:hypothetical protein n=1 Tax=Streptomyces sp. MBT65 TaxID=1488395 RepID=UPI001909429D|nr:hypothetical protein [Streptomyces sp. MBT65]MBK3578234.1 hypothetical protein [Streptomyces sp. MBT65]
MRQLAIAAAPVTAPAHTSAPAAVPPGQVYFWPEAGQMGAGGGCLYREIRPDDHSDNWAEWGGRFDGVSDTRMGCEAG